MNKLMYYPVAALMAGGVAKGDMCPTSVEILLLQDSSVSLKDIIQTLSQDLGEQMQEWAQNFNGTVKIGMSSFTDKPIPLLGYGNRNAIPYEDGCYFRSEATALSPDVSKFASELTNLRLRNGGDLAEAHWDAIVSGLSDPLVGFSHPSKVYDENNAKIARILLVVTDEAAHSTGEAQAAIDHFNGPLAPPGDYYTPGGFGSLSLVSTASGLPTTNQTGSLLGNMDETYNIPDYIVNLSNLIYKDPSSRTAADNATLAASIEKYGPAHFYPEKVRPHPGTLIQGYDCSNFEYANVGLVKEALDRTRVIPLVLVGSESNIQSTSIDAYCLSINPNYNSKKNQDKAKCFEAWYKQQFSDAGITSFVSAYPSAKQIIATLNTAVTSVAEYNCGLELPPYVEPSTTTTTPEPTTTTTTATEEEAPAAADGDSGSSGPNIGLIAGATGGAVAAVAAAGAVLYKKFGASLFGKKPLPDAAGVQQVESPDQNIEREGMEEVTMDMFQ